MIEKFNALKIPKEFWGTKNAKHFLVRCVRNKRIKININFTLTRNITKSITELKIKNPITNI